MGTKVLVVDDSLTVRQQISTVLRQSGYDVLEAHDGVEGLQYIERFKDLGIVISDVNMPRMNGIEMIEKVRASGNREELPIVMLTTEGSPSLIKRARELGAKGWIVKPFKADHLLAAVEKLTGA